MITKGSWFFLVLALASLFFYGGCATAPEQAEAPQTSPVVTPAFEQPEVVPHIEPADIPRMAPAEAYRKANAGTALLVCAYGIDERCKMMRLEGAISLREFESRLASVPKDQEIIFYCA